MGSAWWVSCSGIRWLDCNLQIELISAMMSYVDDGVACCLVNRLRNAIAVLGHCVDWRSMLYRHAPPVGNIRLDTRSASVCAPSSSKSGELVAPNKS